MADPVPTPEELARWECAWAKEGYPDSRAGVRLITTVRSLRAEVAQLALELKTSRETVDRMDRLYRKREREDAERYVEMERLRAEVERLTDRLEEPPGPGAACEGPCCR